jgi:hypothetical protein
MSEVVDLVNNAEMPELRAGETHSFSPVWMVVVDGRIFCRQYKLNMKSWYNAFLDDPSGYIHVNGKEFKVRGVVPVDLASLQERINQAYVEKYKERFDMYSAIADKMIEPEHMKNTLELIPE